MPIVELTAVVARQATCPAGKTKMDYFDRGLTGFILTVFASGAKTYSLRYRDHHNVLRQHRIGRYEDLPFDKAKQAAHKLRAQVVLGEDPSAAKQAQRQVPTLATFYTQHYLPHIQGYRRQWRTDDSYWRHHLEPGLGHLHLDQITQEAVIKFQHGLKAEGYSAVMANRGVAILRAMFNLAKRWQIPGVTENPAKGIKEFKMLGRERYLTQEETRRLLAELTRYRANPMMQYIIPLFLLTGMRKRELLDSQWCDIDLERRQWKIPVTKTGNPRFIPISDGVMAILQQLPRPARCPYVLPNPWTLLPFQSVQHSWNAIRQEAGLTDVRIHDLRHAYASYLAQAGCSLQVIGKLLGHTAIKTTFRYAHLDNAQLRQATNEAAKIVGATLAPEDPAAD
jgi:integrase